MYLLVSLFFAFVFVFICSLVFYLFVRSFICWTCLLLYFYCFLWFKKIVITGVGSLSSVGIGSDDHYRALLEGTNGIETLPEWAEEYPCKVGTTALIIY